MLCTKGAVVPVAATACVRATCYAVRSQRPAPESGPMLCIMTSCIQRLCHASCQTQVPVHAPWQRSASHSYPLRLACMLAAFGACHAFRLALAPSSRACILAAAFDACAMHCARHPRSVRQAGVMLHAAHKQGSASQCQLSDASLHAGAAQCVGAGLGQSRSRRTG